MGWFIDILLVAVLAFYVVRHFHYGLMHTVYNIGKFIAAFLLAAIFGRPLAGYLADGVIGDAVTAKVFDKISEYVGGSESLSAFFNDVPEGFASLVKLFGVDMAALREQYGTAEGSEAILRDMAETISYPISGTISAIIAYVAIFVVSLAILSVVVMLLAKIKLPILTGLDKTLGLLLGLVLGLMNVALISTVVYSGLEFFAAMNENSEIMNVYYDSFVFKFVYDLKIFEFIRNLI